MHEIDRENIRVFNTIAGNFIAEMQNHDDQVFYTRFLYGIRFNEEKKAIEIFPAGLQNAEETVHVQKNNVIFSGKPYDNVIDVFVNVLSQKYPELKLK